MQSRYTVLMDVITGRHSCRSYRNEEVPEELLLKVLEAGRMAPSACNRQPWRFVVAHSPEALAALRPALRKEGLRTAPAIIVCIGCHDCAWHRPSDGKDHTDIDVAIAVDHLTLAAEALGLASCWVCSFDVEMVNCALQLAPDEEAVALLPIGFSAEETVATKSRKTCGETVTWL